MNSNALIFLGVGAVLVVPMLLLIAQGHFVLAGLLVGAVFFILLFRRPDAWWCIAVATIGSNLHLVNPNATIHMMAMLAFAGLGIMRFVMTQGRYQVDACVVRRVAMFILFLIILTASVRGWGLRILGSANWGGVRYIIVLSSIFFYLFSFQIRISEKQLWNTLKWLGVLGLVPAGVAFLLLVLPQLAVVQLFIAVGRAAVDGIELGQERALAGAHFSAIWAALFGLMLYDRSFRLSLPVLGLAGLTMLIIGLSGFRSLVILAGVTVAIYLLVRRKSAPSRHRVTVIVSITLAVVGIYIVTPFLPVTFQRALAFLPGLNVVHEAQISAVTTTDWRIEMWRLMLPMIPRYLWIGRGLGFDLMEAYSAYTLASDFTLWQFYIATHNYHNGPLWLLMDLGLGGLIGGAIFMFAGLVRYWRLFAAVPPRTRWSTGYAVVFSFFAASVLYFWTVIGTHDSFSRMLVLAGVLEVIARSSRRELVPAVETDAKAAPVRPAQPKWKDFEGRGVPALAYRGR